MKPLEGIDLKQLFKECEAEFKKEIEERKKFNGQTWAEIYEEYKAKEIWLRPY